MSNQEKLMYSKLSNEAKRDYFSNAVSYMVMFDLIKKRKEKNITQKELADRMGVKQSYISKIENLAKTPTIETIGKYIFALTDNTEIVGTRSFDDALIKYIVDICPEAKKKFKALEIIKEKDVNIGLIRDKDCTLEIYNTMMLLKQWQLTQEEYDLLREVLL